MCYVSNERKQILDQICNRLFLSRGYTFCSYDRINLLISYFVCTLYHNMFIPSCFGVFIVVPITAVIQLFRVQIMPVYHVYTVRWMVVALPVQIFLVRSRSPFYLIIGFELFLGAALLHLIALQLTKRKDRETDGNFGVV